MRLILERFKRLIAANLRELVEAAKDPEIELLEFVADLECSYGEIKSEMVDAANSVDRLERQLSETETEVERWNQKAASALRQGEENLAREALLRKCKNQSLAAHIRSELRDQVELADSLLQTLKDLQHQLHEAQTQRNELLAKADRAAASDRVANILKSKIWWRQDPSLERLSRDILERKHRLESYQELQHDSLEAEFQRLSGAHDVEAELKDLKKAVSEEKKQ